MVHYVRKNTQFPSPKNCPRDPGQCGYQFIERYPQPLPSAAPDYTPDNLAAYYIGKHSGRTPI
jgi:hypothetical protein